LLIKGQGFQSPLAGLGAGILDYAGTKLHWKRHYGIDYTWAYFVPSGDELNKLCAMAEEGKLKSNIAATFSFDEFAKAFEMLDNSTGAPRPSGKIVIKV